MPLINGSITYRKFNLGDSVPRTFRDTLTHRLPKYCFREIDPKKNPELSIGWVNAMNPVDNHLNAEKVIHGKYIILGLRRDKKSLSAALLKAALSEAIRAQLRERKARKLAREEMGALKETVKEQMLARVSATTTLYEAVWNFETGEVFFSAQAEKACLEFMEIFEDTFEIPLADCNLAARAEAFIAGQDKDIDLESVQPAHFGQ